MGGDIFLPGSQPFLHVNVNGERFMNEDQCYPMSYAAGANQPRHYSWIVWDGNYWDDISPVRHLRLLAPVPRRPLAPPSTPTCTTARPCPRSTWTSSGSNPRLEAGTLKKADTLRGAGRHDGVRRRPEGHVPGHRRALQRAWRPPARTPTSASRPTVCPTWQTAPFYAARIGGELLVTIHGVITDVNSQPLRERRHAPSRACTSAATTRAASIRTTTRATSRASTPAARPRSLASPPSTPWASNRATARFSRACPLPSAGDFRAPLRGSPFLWNGCIGLCKIGHFS